MTDAPRTESVKHRLEETFGSETVNAIVKGFMDSGMVSRYGDEEDAIRLFIHWSMTTRNKIPGMEDAIDVLNAWRLSEGYHLNFYEQAQATMQAAEFEAIELQMDLEIMADTTREVHAEISTKLADHSDNTERDRK